MPPSELFAPGPDVRPGPSDRIQALVAQRLEEDLSRAGHLLSECIDPGAPGNLQSVVEWLNARTLWEQLSDEVRRAVLTDPSFRFFLHGILRLGRQPDRSEAVPTFARNFAGLIWAAGLGSVEGWRGSAVLDDRGGLRAIPARRYVEFGSARAHSPVQIQLAKDRAKFTFDDGCVVQIPPEDIWSPIETPPDLETYGYEIAVAPAVGEGGLVASARDPWLRVKLSGTNQRLDGVGFLDRDDEHYARDPDLSNLRSAEQRIAALWPEEARDLAVFVGVIVPYLSADTSHIAFTVSSRQGAIFIGPAPPTATAEMILHEKAHVKLRQLQKLDPLLQNPLDESLCVAVPWRPDPRPIPGVLEGLYVFAHVAEFHRRAALADGDAAAAARCAQLAADLGCALVLLKTHARVTPMGAVFLSSMSAWIDRLADGTGPLGAASNAAGEGSERLERRGQNA